MRGKAILVGTVAAMITVLVGCHHEKYKLKSKHPEDYVVPPNDPRFDQPPEADYRRPPAKKQDTPSKMGSPGMMGGNGGTGF